MEINELAKQHLEFCEKKGLPIEIVDLPFLIGRIQSELDEVKEAFTKEHYVGHLQEELVDVLLQTMQALAVINPDVELAIKRKVSTNQSRKWREK